MDSQRYLAEHRPELRLVVDEMPPKGTKLWLVTIHGHGFAGEYHPEYQVVAWSPLPKFSPEQKRRLRGMAAVNVDPTKNMAKAWEAREENPPSCVGYER